MSTKLNYVRNLFIEKYSYELPQHNIAFYPLVHRDQSKLLVSKGHLVTHHQFTELPNLLTNNELLVFNQTRVVAARVLFQNKNGAPIEVFCLHPEPEHLDVQSALQQTGEVFWNCLVGKASKWKNGELLSKTENGITITAEKLHQKEGHFLLHFTWQPAAFTFAEVLQKTGVVPLPPYIKRKSEEADTERYQTVYSQEEGSVAAPTAGLHFSNDVLEQLKKKKVETDFLTLHVGAGTFIPVKSKTIGEHDMHEEWVSIPLTLIEKLLFNSENHEKKTVAVGTTSLRSLESLYWIGVQILEEKINDEFPEITQWEPYTAHTNFSVSESLAAVINYMKSKNQNTLMAKTGILIAPGYDFKIVEGLVTNFHQPGSTLLLLVAAFIGEDWRKVYEAALEHNYRFLSYGDSSLLWKKID